MIGKNWQLLIDSRLKLINKYNNKIEELEILKESLGNDLKRIYQEIPYSKLLYNELKKCYFDNNKQNQKELKSLLKYYLGESDFKYDFSKIINVNYNKSFRIEFTYKKKIYSIQFTNPDMIESKDFYNGKSFIEDLGISLYCRDSQVSLTLIGSALTDGELKKLINEKVIKND